MENAQFFDDQFVTATALNAGVTAASGSLTALASGINRPGLVRPDVASFVASGLSVASSLPSPFGILFNDGVLSLAHGVTDGADTQSYNTSFSSLVPSGSGSTTAYLLASHISIQQSPFAIVGPPPGHPDFNPNFQPYTAYNRQVDSIELTASSTPPDNTTTFELFRTVLTSGTTTVDVSETCYQFRQSGNNNMQIVTQSASGVIPVTTYGQAIKITGAGPFILPPAAQANGITLTLFNTTGQPVIVGTDQDIAIPDEIIGTEPWPYIGQPAFYIDPGQCVRLFGAECSWQIISGEPRMAAVVPGAWVRNSGSGDFVVGSDCPSNVTTLYVEVVGGGGGGASIFASGGTYYTGGGGGGGGWAQGYVPVFQGQSIAWSVGAGGSGGTSGASGQAGSGSTTVFEFISASGGVGGHVYDLILATRSSAGGGGGVGSGGFNNLVGGTGGNGDDIGSADGNIGAGYGGVTYYGGGGSWQSNAPGLTGAPGTGGPGVFGTNAFAGGTGRGGQIIVRWGL